MTIPATHSDHRQARQRRPSPLWWFVSLSLLLHLALLMDRQPTFSPVAPQQALGMTVHLVERRQPTLVAQRQPAQQQQSPRPEAKPRQTKASKAQPIRSKPAPKPRTISPDKQIAPTGVESMALANEPVAESKTIDDAALQSSLKVTLTQEITRHFTYPLLARKRGWQGEVLLAFRLEADGRIVDARVARSSGYGVLDRAALDALAKVQRIKPETEHGFAMQIPIIYRLES